jgi:hypothetical protein
MVIYTNLGGEKKNSNNDHFFWARIEIFQLLDQWWKLNYSPSNG